jgi:hypothetical protein
VHLFHMIRLVSRGSCTRFTENDWSLDCSCYTFVIGCKYDCADAASGAVIPGTPDRLGTTDAYLGLKVWSVLFVMG